MNITSLLLAILTLTLIGCSKDSSQSSSKGEFEYARLSRIQGNGDQFGTRYFWESRDLKTDAMNFKELHEHFDLELPKEGELKVTPFDYNVIDKICDSGWELVSVNSSAGYSDPPSSYNPVKSYHFVRKK